MAADNLNIQSREIHLLIEGMMSSLVENEPSDHIKFMIYYLKRMSNNIVIFLLTSVFILESGKILNFLTIFIDHNSVLSKIRNFYRKFKVAVFFIFRVNSIKNINNLIYVVRIAVF